MTTFDNRMLRDLSRSLQLEWLETDGLGGFAMSTVVGANTRRYHGLLVAATQPPVGRRVLVAKVEDRVRVDGITCELSCNVYQNAVHPHGHEKQVEFRLDPWPVFTWHDCGVTLQKSVFMPHKLGITVIRYDLLEAPGAAWLHARPLLSGRDMHLLNHATVELNDLVSMPLHTVHIQPFDPASRASLYFPDGEFRMESLWYYNFHYFREEESGLDHLEDLYTPGEITWLMRPGETRWLVLGQQAPEGFDGEELMKSERRRRQKLLTSFGDDEVAGRLALAADQFIVDRTVRDQPSKTIIAGYPWFGDWGRDTMIALFGLTLTTKRYDDCRAMLSTFVSEMHGGLVPNLFAESGDASYNTCDATLWLFAAFKEYARLTKDYDLIANVWPALRASLQAHIDGTDFNIHMTEDGLLWAGDETTQLTWMDAKIDDWVVTPRHGKAVEINGLWYNALKIGEFFAGKLGDTASATELGRLAKRTKVGFAQFWAPELGYCYDVLRDDLGGDECCRPNQLIACSLPYGLLSLEQRRSILKVTSDQLLVPYGIRTLACCHDGYCPVYRGDRVARDAAYHQGTTWPWLLGPYLTTYFGVMGVTDQTRRQVRALLQPLVDHLDEAGLGSISEIFDAEDPFAPHGCIAQAWSVGEVLRCWVQYKLGSVER